MSDLEKAERLSQIGRLASVPWLSVDDPGDDGPIWVRVIGGIFGDRAEELWSTLEFALQEALGRAVVVNLVDVTGFDILAVEALIAVARTAKRQHVDMCAVVEPASVMRDHMASNSLGRLIPIYDSTEAASVAADTVVADEPEATLLVKSYLWASRRAASSDRLRCEPLHLVDAT